MSARFVPPVGYLDCACRDRHRTANVVHIADVLERMLRECELHGGYYGSTETSAALKAGAAALRDVDAAKELLAVMHRDGGHHTHEVGFVQSCKDAEQVRHNLVRDIEELRAALDHLRSEAGPESCAALAKENAELRARLEDARKLAVYYATNGITPLEGSVRECVSRILAHPIGTAQDDDADDVIDNECYTHMPLAHPAPAPASMRDLAPILSVEAIGDGNAVVRFTDRSETLVPLGDKAPAQATCGECGGTGWRIVNPNWPKGTEPYREHCPNGCEPIDPLSDRPAQATCPAVLAACSECGARLATGANLDEDGDIEARIEPHRCAAYPSVTEYRHPAPAPASMFDSCACHGHMTGDVIHGPFNCIEQAPAQATCPECNGEGEVISADAWYKPCPACRGAK